jgi:hypothetical protein
VIGSLLRLASIACSLIVLLSFAMFATDEANHGSKQTVATLGEADGPAGSRRAPGPQDNINAPDPTARTEHAREKRHSSLREFVDDANDVLVTPFKGVVAGSKSIWAQRIVTTLLALLAFGVGLRMLSAWVPSLRR